MRLAGAVRNVGLTLVALVATVCVSGCDVVVNSMDGGRARATDHWSRTYSLGEQGTIEVGNINGKIQVEGVDASTFEVEATISVRAGTDEAAREHLKQVEITEEKGTGRVRLEAKYPKSMGRTGVEVSYVIRVPRTAKVDVETVNGGIELATLSGPVRAETTNGGVKGRGLSGGVNASSTNGGIDIAVSAIAPEGVSIETTNGGVELVVPADAKGTVSARCVNGGISVTDLAIEKGQTSRRKLEGTLNGGGPSIRLETVNGGIRLRRS